MMQRDIPSFDKYVLSEQTKEALKTLEFDIWQWEPNEVSQNENLLLFQVDQYLNVILRV